MCDKNWLDAFVREYTTPNAETAARIERVCECKCKREYIYIDITDRPDAAAIEAADEQADADDYHFVCVAAAIECAEASVTLPGIVALWSREARDKHTLEIASAIEGV